MVESPGCSTPPVVSKIVFQDHNHVVRLDVTYRVGNQEHSHPAMLAPEDLAIVLQAIEAIPQRNLLSGRLGTSTSTTSAAFSDEQVRFLAPLLAQGLNQATPLEEVVFYLNQPRNRTIREITSGSLYVQGPNLHLLLANYRHATSGNLETEKATTNPLTILGEPMYDLSPGPYGRIFGELPWLKSFAIAPQHLILDYQVLVRSEDDRGGLNLGKHDEDSSPHSSIHNKLRLLRDLKNLGLLTDQEYQEKRMQVLETD